jgi:uroporphyrinogen III methyltransferase/synthase
MGVRSLPRITEALQREGLSPDTPAAAVQWGTRADQKALVATLATLSQCVAEAGLEAPVIFVIGGVAALRDEISWFERRPLFKWRILVTRAQSPRSTLAAELAAAGADVVEAPATRIEPLEPGRLRASISHLDAYDWIVFTSQNGVSLFWDELRLRGADARALAGLRVAAVGPATADALLERGIAVDVTPDRFVAEGVLEVLQARSDLGNAHVLYVAAEGARDVLPNGLTELGARVDVVPAYRSTPDRDGTAAMRQFVANGDRRSIAAFTSASAVRAFVDAVGEEGRRIAAATIGPATSAAAREAGLEICVEASRATIPALVEAIVAHGSSLKGEFPG